MENSPYRRQKGPAARVGNDSARLIRSRSGGTTPPTAQAGNEGTPLKSAKKTQKKQEPIANNGDGGGFITFLPRSKSQVEIPRQARSRTTSPSAWALSPGRPSPWTSPAPQSPARFEKPTKQESRSRGVSGVLKYFKQKKVSPVLEEDYHQYRVAYDRLLQWRFANARAEASMAATKTTSQKKLWNGFARISATRNLMAEKKLRIEQMNRELKVYEKMKWEMRMLEEWSRMEKKNAEAIGRLIRKLNAITVCLPLLQNAKGDTTSLTDAILTATEVMEGIKSVVVDKQGQVEKTGFLLTELSVILHQQQQLFPDLEARVTLSASSVVQEKILRAQQIQLVNEVNTIES